MSSLDHDSQAAKDYITALRAGATSDDAALVAGVDPIIVGNWMDNQDFADRVERVHSELRVLASGYLRQHMQARPNVAMAFLERAEGEKKLRDLRKLTTDEG
jgi:hypothetical protein